MTGIILVLFLSLYFILSNISFALNTWQFWIIVIFSCCLGALVGYLINRIGNNLAAIMLAGIVGFIVGEFVFTLALKYIKSNPTIVYWSVIAFTILFFVFIGCCFADQIMITTTAIVGGYGVMRVILSLNKGAAFMIGYYPDEKQIYQLMNNNEWDQVNKVDKIINLAIYLASLCILYCFPYICDKWYSDSMQVFQRSSHRKK